MNLYIDIENLLSFVESKDKELYDECIRLIQRQLDVYFNFKKDDVRQSVALNFWMAKYNTQGVGTKKKEFLDNKDEKFPPRPLKSNCSTFMTKEQLSSVYLINDDKIDAVITKGSILIGKPNEELDILHRLFFKQNDYLFEKRISLKDVAFINWDYLKNYFLPFTDLIIVDNYLLSNKDLIKPNLIELMLSMVEKIRTKINIVIVIRPDKLYLDLDFNQVKKELQEAVSKITEIKPNITFIKTRTQHDRNIVTNYKRIYSGDSFNYFDNSGRRLSKGQEIVFSSHANSDNYKSALELLAEIQKVVISCPDDVFGDKKSGFLSFS